VNELEPIAAGTRSPILEGALRFARPVFVGGDDMAFQAGAELAPWPHAARLQLAHGKNPWGAFGRRQRRTADCADSTAACSRTRFDALGGAPWGGIARVRKLAGFGEDEPSAQLTSWLTHCHRRNLDRALAAAEMTNRRSAGNCSSRIVRSARTFTRVPRRLRNHAAFPTARALQERSRQPS